MPTLTGLSPYGTDVLALGEALIDLVPDGPGIGIAESAGFRKRLGGAVLNVAVGLARLGRASAYMGMVSEDPFGDFLMAEMGAEQVGRRFVARTADAPTGLAFIALAADGDRSFVYYRDNTAEQHFGAGDVHPGALADSRILTLGSGLLPLADNRAAVHLVMQQAREHGVCVAMDCNIRMPRWSSEAEAAEQIGVVARQADLIKVNTEELALLAGATADGAALDLGGMATADLAQAYFAAHLRPHGVAALVVTDGPRGALVVTETVRTQVTAPQVEVLDTTGAGDGFMAALLARLCREADRRWLRPRALGFPTPRQHAQLLGEWTAQQWQAALALACFAGSRVCTTYGATPGLPRISDVPEALWRLA